MNILEERIEYNGHHAVKVTFMTVKKYGPHYHTHDLEIIYCLKGTIRIKCVYETIELNEGEFFTASQRDMHAIESACSENLIALFHLDLTATSIPWDSLEKEIFIFENTHHDSFHFTDESQEKIIDILMLLALNTVYGPVNDEVFFHASEKLIHMLVGSFTYVNYARREYNLPQNVKELISQMSAYIADHYSERISISTFADHSHFSKTYLANFIKSNLRLTFNEILNYVRCTYAEILLLTTDKSNLEISNECGFSDSKYFYHHFKKWYSLTPIQHKEWYEHFCEEPDEYHVFDSADLKGFIKSYYCAYHSAKTTAVLLSGK